MADLRKVVIEIKLSGGENITPKPTPAPTPESDQAKEGSNVSLLDNVIVMQAFEQTKGLIKNLAMYGATRYFAQKEDYRGAQNLEHAMTALQKATSFAVTMAGGFKLGSALGPEGGVAGAIIASGAWVANQGIEAYKKYESLNYSLSTSGYQTGFLNMRAGLIDNGKGTEN